MTKKPRAGSLHGDRPNVGELPLEEDVRREVQAHIRLRTDELMAQGWSEAAAREEALRAFGEMEPVVRECEEVTRARDRSVRRGQRMEAVVQDLRYAVRSLRASPMFTLVAMVTLGLGIGANSAIFSVINGVLLRPLPYPEPDRLVWASEINTRGGTMAVAWANFLDWHTETSSYQGLTALGSGATTVLGGAEPTRTTVASVSQDFWRVFPVRPEVGRLTTMEDHVEGAVPVAVVSEGFWRNQLGGGDPSEQVLEISGTEATVVGVVPEEFAYPAGAQVWTPMEPGQPSAGSRTSHNWTVVGRLDDEVTIESAAAELDALTKRIVLREAGADPDFLATGALVIPLHERVVGDSGTALFLLLGAAGLVLLIACTNLASTLLARGSHRGRELAVRASLGAGRSRIVRQLLTESLVLATLGGAAGLACGVMLVQGLKALGPASVPRLDDVGLDVGVLGFTVVMTLGTAVLFGLFPALRLTRDDLGTVLRTGVRGNSADRRGTVWRLLIGTEMALALVLLVGSGLLLRSFQTLLAVDTGFDAQDVTVADVTLSQLKYPEEQDHARFYAQLASDLAASPDVVSVGVSSTIPIAGFLPNGRMELDGDLTKTITAGYVLADPGFFETLDIQLLQGRTFQPSDGPDDPHVAMVSRRFAEMAWPGEDAVGKQVNGGGMDNFWQSRTFATVVGVVGDVKYRGLDEEGAYPVAYFPLSQRPFRAQFGAVVTTESARAGAAPVNGVVRSTLTSSDADIPIRLSALSDRVAESLLERRFVMLVLGGFSAIALMLAGVGIYGVVSYTVARRTREMGVRMALGADSASVRAMVVRGAMGMALGGVLVGIVTALAAARLMQGLLFETSTWDPVTLLGTVTVLVLVALLASWVPARSGTRIDPMITMRAE